jgi:hypothetical protein
LLIFRVILLCQSPVDSTFKVNVIIEELGLNKYRQVVTVNMEKSAELDTTRTEKVLAIDETTDFNLDKRLNRKFDLHILPWLFGIW